MDAKLLSIPTALAGGAGGTYLGYKYLSQDSKSESIKSKLEPFLLKFESSFDDKWTERATLVSSKSDLHESLSKLKGTGNAITKDQIKGWCQEQIEREFSSETDPLFLNIRRYCTFNNKDKLDGKAISEALETNGLKSEGQWTKANKRLKDESGSLSSKMQEFKTELSKNSGADDKVLKNWCEASYTDYFKGVEDQVFKDLEVYCTKVS
ncbi:hypothetical protein HF1_13760 [Mycoplasma haemofelis str. Langford 1]|uniref:Uncharacterized protein n=1 Tax=Mycoplasma haemofelis (strain Langford 1) TaxID=941640 RepID=E8ZJR3_MYCHL|nr:hypothetical protein [Mycoplasma haemofelis]CBY93384.1 hypothetical protein HF1_13760 [Mycoplasma haemofelis str. Langford 1]